MSVNDTILFLFPCIINTMTKDLDQLFDSYEGNLLNYFSGLTPEESKRFNKQQAQLKKNCYKPYRTIHNY